MTMVEKNFGEHKLPEDFVEKVKKVIPGETTSQQVIEFFGKPDRYSYWKEGAVPEEALPDSMDYDEAGVSFVMYGTDTVGEVRIESNKDYSYEGEIGLGSSLELTFRIIQKVKNEFNRETADEHSDNENETTGKRENEREINSR